MRHIILSLLLVVFASAQTVIRVNLLGYLPEDPKHAVLLSKDGYSPSAFSVHNALTGDVVLDSDAITSYGEWGSFNTSFRMDLSAVSDPGAYYVRTGTFTSEIFRIGAHVYTGAPDFILQYMRQQRCGFNPYLKDSCHTRDGYIIYDSAGDSAYIDVTGGWHDASDYLQYVATSANATFQMLYAFQSYPQVYGDQHLANGLPGRNGIPDILDEARWGLEWLLKMNPEKDVMYNQIADDRDHLGFRLPTQDTVSYDRGSERPVYLCTGKPQGVKQHRNRSTGIASTAGKYASAFALGAHVLSAWDLEFGKLLVRSSIEAYEYGKVHPGVCQTAPCRAPYFYEEDNWADDMELAAAQLYRITKIKPYLDDAVIFGLKEEVTPWMGADTARHYQWYPFLNMGHTFVAREQKGLTERFKDFLRTGLEGIYTRGQDNPFLFGVPFIWCSNNLVTAAMTQARLYQEITGDARYHEMEIALRDWLLGCNPWGTSMIVGFPAHAENPQDPHSAFTHLHGMPIDGGLVDGPVSASIYNSLLGIHLSEADEFAAVQPGMAVYHDDYGDYSTNEPTMDGTATLSYYLASQAGIPDRNLTHDNDGIVRMDSTRKVIYLIFSAHEYADGYETIVKSLDKHNALASFFFTGDFYRNEVFQEMIRDLDQRGHYLGAHSDRHLLYASWEDRDSSLVNYRELVEDIRNNYMELSRFGISPADAPYFLPPYEWYNAEIAAGVNSLGLTLINMTPGTGTNRDYTDPGMGDRYVSNKKLLKDALAFEEQSASGLNGHLLLIHFGTKPERKKKFYDDLDKLLSKLADRGYTFARL